MMSKIIFGEQITLDSWLKSADNAEASKQASKQASKHLLRLIMSSYFRIESKRYNRLLINMA